MPTAQVVQDTDKEVLAPEYTDDMQAQRGSLLRLIRTAKEQRDRPHVQFNDMTYEQWYAINEKESFAYNPPKTNESDHRIKNGLSNSKVVTLTSHFLNYNFESDVEAYDDTDRDEVFVNNQKLSTHIESMIKKQKNVEDFEDKIPMIYMELFTQGDVFCQVTEEPVDEVKKKLKNENYNDKDKITMADLAFEKVENPKARSILETNTVHGKNFFPGNVWESTIEKQPFIFTRRRLSYEAARTKYGRFERFENVPRSLEDFDDNGGNWIQDNFKQGYVEEIIYQSAPDDELQIFLNNVPILPVGFPLSSIMGIPRYTIVMGSTEKRLGFFYSKGAVAKIASNNNMIDIFLRGMVRKQEQNIAPPMSNMTETEFGMEIFDAARVTKGLDPDLVKPLIKTAGITSSDVQMMGMLNDIVDQDSFSKIMEGESVTGEQTLGEVNKLQTNSLKKLILMTKGVQNFHKKLDWLKTYMILRTWTLPIDRRVDAAREQIKDVYRKIHTTAEEKGMEIDKIMSFTDGAIPAVEQEDAMGRILTEKRGKPTKIYHLSAPELRNLKYIFYFNTVPTENETSEIRAARFEESLMKAMQIFPMLGKQVNPDYASQRWAVHNKENPDAYFVQEQEQGGMNEMIAQSQGGGQPQPQGQISAQMQPKQMPAPSLNTLKSQ